MFCLLLFIIIARCYYFDILCLMRSMSNRESQTLGRVASDDMALTVLRAWIQAVDLSGSFFPTRFQGL